MIKSYTDLSQSKKLAEILPFKSADMYYMETSYNNYTVGVLQRMERDMLLKQAEYYKMSPCWSLVALSEFILPYIADDNGNNYKFYLSKDGLDRWIACYKSNDVSIHICEESRNMIDVIFEMVCWLKTEEYF